MSKRFKLHMLVEDGHLRIMPKGDLAFQDVNVILGAARSALRVFPVLIVDLVEVRELAAQVPDLLEDGLRSLITEQKSVLRQKMPHLRWKVYQPAPHIHRCDCQGSCRNCPCRGEEESQAPKGTFRAGNE
jgi:hypothetical protein